VNKAKFISLICASRVFQTLFLISFGCAPLVAAAQPLSIDKANVLSAANQKYYNLRNAGLTELQVNIQPNWDVLLAGADVPASERALLNGLRFSCSIDPQARLSINYRSETPPPDARSEQKVARMFRGMEDALRLFFRTWSLFSITSPFPTAGSEYAFEKKETGYHFSQQQAELLVETDADNDFMIKEIKVSRPELTASLKPVLERTPTGFLLKGYTANSQRSSGARATTIRALLEYDTVNGLKLLRRVSLDTTFEGAPAKVEWLFTDYQVKVR
jgi:hypothetical protein